MNLVWNDSTLFSSISVLMLIVVFFLFVCLEVLFKSSMKGLSEMLQSPKETGVGPKNK